MVALQKGFIPTDILSPGAIYNGGYPSAKEVRLRIANGGAGQSGLVEAFANAYIQFSVETKGVKPFLVAWYLGDTTQSLQYLASKFVDVALTYNAAAEKHCVDSGAASQRELVFLDHFYLVGPKPNPAELSTSNDSVTDMFNKIVASGNEDTLRPPNPSIRPPTRFLSRFDKSATNIKESELFVKIGQVPWAYAYSTWYHQYARFPLQALEAASYLAEYTLTDRGTWLSSPSSVTSNLVIYKGAESTEDEAVLLNPCSALSAPDTANKEMAEDFMNWVVRDDGGQQVVKDFKKNGERLYSPRPKKQ
ncbi:hypothetical protein E1B28_005808 [Marasmius oreades]|uniref:PBP domain-containing protein n=1 Tax=Marasmius oreades TaxID=181124 RepID=A0A9P7UUY7_9AGAR|nr:uncharacterized protein E1B28_005808 [Marasmius oreades]KAG7095013.1 hypothetical protein E1B28_005808 [Marasmius oreades]